MECVGVLVCMSVRYVTVLVGFLVSHGFYNLPFIGSLRSHVWKSRISVLLQVTEKDWVGSNHLK